MSKGSLDMYYDTALECYRGLWNLSQCFGMKCLIVENLVLALHCGASLVYTNIP